MARTNGTPDIFWDPILQKGGSEEIVSSQYLLAEV
jgi:hypothetical protein